MNWKKATVVGTIMFGHTVSMLNIGKQPRALTPQAAVAATVINCGLIYLVVTS